MIVIFLGRFMINVICTLMFGELVVRVKLCILRFMNVVSEIVICRVKLLVVVKMLFDLLVVMELKDMVFLKVFFVVLFVCL